MGDDTLVLLTMQHCRDLLRLELNQRMLTVFRQATGYRLGVLWHSGDAGYAVSSGSITCPKAHRRRAYKLPPRCASCLRRNWLHAWAPGKEHQFRGACGMVNYCAGVRIGKLCPAVLVVQDKSGVHQRDRKGFAQAILLAGLILHSLENVLQNRLAVLELENTREVLKRLEAQHDRPERPVLPPITLHTSSGHTRQLVERMLDYIHEHYRLPVQLGDLARAVNLNPAYVSSLFSKVLGVTFHHYLEDLRLARAKELLTDPLRRVREVACAVGYPNPNHFRQLFHSRVGVSPSLWRNSVRAPG